MKIGGRYTAILAAALMSFAASAQDKPAGQTAPPPPTASQPAPLPVVEDPIEAFTKGRLMLNLRPRVEWVDQDTKTDDALAFTNRTLLGWQTASWKGFSGVAQLIDVANFNGSYNEGPAASAQYPTIADPDNTDLNQIYLDYAGLPDTRIRLGKQSLKLDNVRFVGNVEFRQVMQVFSGVLLENKSLPGVELELRAFRPHQEHLRAAAPDRHRPVPGRVDLAAGERAGGLRVLPGPTQYRTRRPASRTTPTASWACAPTARWPLGGVKLLYTGELAQQDAYAGGDSRIDASYSRIGAGVGFGKSFVRLDYDRLGSNGGVYGFQTPLGTNHLFQGWADQFLTTPAQGIRDVYLSAGTTVGDVQLYTEVHDFRSDFGSIHYGSEVDFGATYAFMKQLTGKFEFAVFQEADQLAGTARKPDTSKVWFTLIYQF